MNAPAVLTRLYLIPPPYVAQVWGLAKPYLDKAVQRGASMQRAEEWLGECINARKQLWLLSGPERCDGAVVTYLAETPSGLACVIDAFGAAKGAAWGPHLSVIETWARAQKCNYVRVYGRVGWMEKLKSYALKGVILDRKL